mmetsp:Transcript_710/g.1423  ORF Transcript_710/g.1423 Transcript_710/m.1423 type:complete len:302 (+) Transcript_710:608-1513(+)
MSSVFNLFWHTRRTCRLATAGASGAMLVSWLPTRVTTSSFLHSPMPSGRQVKALNSTDNAFSPVMFLISSGKVVRPFMFRFRSVRLESCPKSGGKLVSTSFFILSVSTWRVLSFQSEGSTLSSASSIRLIDNSLLTSARASFTSGHAALEAAFLIASAIFSFSASFFAFSSSMAFCSCERFSLSALFLSKISFFLAISASDNSISSGSFNQSSKNFSIALAVFSSACLRAVFPLRSFLFKSAPFSRSSRAPGTQHCWAATISGVMPSSSSQPKSMSFWPLIRSMHSSIHFRDFNFSNWTQT